MLTAAAAPNRHLKLKLRTQLPTPGTCSSSQTFFFTRQSKQIFTPQGSIFRSTPQGTPSPES